MCPSPFLPLLCALCALCGEILFPSLTPVLSCSIRLQLVRAPRSNSSNLVSPTCCVLPLRFCKARCLSTRTLGICHCSNNSKRLPILLHLLDSCSGPSLHDRVHDLILAVDLTLPTKGLENYKSASQRARICSEAWGIRNLYCPCCDSNHVSQLPGNTPAVDYRCPQCDAGFQLKCSSKPFGRRLLDGAYSKMHHAMFHSETPNFLLMWYRLETLRIHDLLCIPDFALTESALEKRKPLALTAHRAGWVGCNILLDRIPTDARIYVVKDARAVAVDEVRTAHRRLKPLASLNVEKRGWTLDVLNVARSLGKPPFKLSEVYAHDKELVRLHPHNRHIRDKIRQQLQVLRDLGLLTFLGGGSYRLTS
jgi:type II restriction enzyme